MTTKNTKPSQLTKLAEARAKIDKPYLSRSSVEWFQQKVKALTDNRRNANSITKETNRIKSRSVLGGLYFFYYSPKYAETLPYYDIFPLVLILKKYPDSFLGLNLHYLPPLYRAAFLNKLKSVTMRDEDNDPVRMRITYALLEQAKNLREFRPCLKQYLLSHMKTKPLKVEPNEWESAIFLPTQQFKKKTTNQVYKESLLDIKKAKMEDFGE